MTELPILLNTEMVKAVLAGRKTQTRLPIKMPEGISAKYEYRGDDGGNELLPKKSGHYWMNGYAMWRPNLLWQVGDRLYVRESFRPYTCGYNSKVKSPVEYKADKLHSKSDIKWRPNIHMPKWAARIWLEITDIRVERVQDITVDDCITEGIKRPKKNNNINVTHWSDSDASSLTIGKDFMFLWKRLYPGSWERNDWVWVISFKRIEK